PVTVTADATQALPSMSGARLGSAPTTPLPRATGTRPPVDGAVAAPLLGERPRRSVLSGLLLWLVIVGTVFGGGGFYAYKKGLIFAKSPDHATDSAAAPRDTTRHTDSAGLATGDSAKGVDSGRVSPAAPPIAPGTPGRLVL